MGAIYIRSRVYKSITARRFTLGKIFIIIFVFLYFFAVAANAVDNIKHKITFEQAKALIWSVMPSDTLQLPKIQIIPADKDPENIDSHKDHDNPRFLFFTVIWNGPQDGVLYYSIDPYTGDIFSLTMDCTEFSNKKLRALQKKVRQTIRLTDAEYRKIKTKEPFCTE